jgi:hypothetical protein
MDADEDGIVTPRMAAVMRQLADAYEGAWSRGEICG